VATFESQALSLTIPGSHVEACRNQACSGATFPSDGCPPVPGKSVCAASFPFPGPSIDALFTHDQRLLVSYLVLPTQVQDGDVYEIHLAAANGSPVIDVRAIATYATVYPNGEGCEPACPFADLSPSSP
jgi:hypothetical protein